MLRCVWQFKNLGPGSRKWHKKVKEAEELHCLLLDGVTLWWCMVYQYHPQVKWYPQSLKHWTHPGPDEEWETFPEHGSDAAPLSSTCVQHLRAQSDRLEAEFPRGRVPTYGFECR